MGKPTDGFILPDVPHINRAEHPDIFLEALSIAAACGSDRLEERFPMGVYPHLSGHTGQGWLVLAVFVASRPAISAPRCGRSTFQPASGQPRTAQSAGHPPD